MKFIAEIGLNHLGDKKRLFNLVDQALKSKVDGITIQVLEKSYYDNSKSHKKWIETSVYQKIYKLVKKKKKIFGLSLRHKETLAIFKEAKIKLDLIKIIGYKYKDESLISNCLKFSNNVYLSSAITSDSDLKRINKKFKKLNFIHTAYNQDIKNSNLLAISHMKNTYKPSKIAFGLHCNNEKILDYVIPFKPSYIFFYIRSSEKKNYPDNIHSIKTKGLKIKLRNLRLINSYLGDGLKKKNKIGNWIDLEKKRQSRKLNSKNFIAVIPARAGSKGIKNKNLRKINGITLIGHAINFAKSSKYIKKIFISSDGKKIENFAKKMNVEFIKRPFSLSNDKIMPDAAVVHAINEAIKRNIEFENVLFLQPTSIFRKKDDLKKAIQKFKKNNYDSLFSGINLHSMVWQYHNEKTNPLNFKLSNRLRRQDIKSKTIIENGSFYLTKKVIWLKNRIRCSGKIGYYEMNKESIFEIDTPEDLKLAKNIITLI